MKARFVRLVLVHRYSDEAKTHRRMRAGITDMVQHWCGVGSAGPVLPGNVPDVKPGGRSREAHSLLLPRRTFLVPPTSLGNHRSSLHAMREGASVLREAASAEPAFASGDDPSLASGCGAVRGVD